MLRGMVATRDETEGKLWLAGVGSSEKLCCHAHRIRECQHYIGQKRDSVELENRAVRV